jgi:zinc transport system substrate-binding protein
MVALESEGKQATAEDLQTVIDYAKQNQITTVFYQEEFDDSQAATVAEEIGGVVQKVAPLSIDIYTRTEGFCLCLVKIRGVIWFNI